MNSLRTRIIDRRIARNTVIQLQTLATSASVNSSTEIKIPIRKERGPTDILQALETTIIRDPTAPDYKYIDDPFLIPTSLSKKRMYSLARESGKRAAMWILQEHADLLRSKLSEPLIEAFLPPEKYENKSQVSEEILNNLIKQGRINDVLLVYHLLEENVSKETKQAILELLCFYNSELDEVSEHFPEERNYQPEKEVNKNVWNNNPDVEKLFGELQNDEATITGAYNAMICGTAKYLKSDRAWQLYNECINKNIPLAVTTYNHIIQLSPLLKDNGEERKLIIQSILQNMVDNGVKPNIGTLNAALKGASTLPAQGLAKEFTLSLIAEFKSIGIEPCLASYYYLLLIFCNPNSSGSSQILLEILDELEKKDKLEMQDPMDKFFFVNAMEVAQAYMHDLSAGDRLHKVLLTKDNYKFIGGRLRENVYYRNYMQLILTNDSIDEFMKVYNTLVPHVYIPEPAVMKEILEILELNDREKILELLPKFLSEIVMFGMMDRHQIMKSVLRLMVGRCQPIAGSPMHQQFAEFAWSLYTHIQEADKKLIQTFMWPAKIYSEIAVLQIRANEFEKMLEVLYFLVKSQDKVVGAISPRNMQELFGACVSRGHATGALAAVEYACEYGLTDANWMAKTVQDTVPLSSTQENQLITLVGIKVLKPENKNLVN